MGDRLKPETVPRLAQILAGTRCRVRAISVVLLLGLFASAFGCGTAPNPDTSPLTTPTTVTRVPERIDLFPAPIGDKWGFINRSGQVVIDARYAGTDYFSEGLACITEGNEDDGFRDGFIDVTGEVVIPPQYEYAGAFGAGLAPVLTSEDYGFIDRTGELVIEPEFRRTESFSEGLAAVETRDGWGYIDATGRFVIQPQRLSAGSAGAFSEGLAAVETRDGRGYIDATGQFVIQPRFWYAEAFAHGLAPVVLEESTSPLNPWGKGGYIDTTGTVVIPLHFDQALRFGDGLAPVLVAEASSEVEEPGWYYIDTTGSIVLGPYEGADPFRGGLARVMTAEGMNAYIDTTGAIIWQSKNIYMDTTTEVGS